MDFITSFQTLVNQLKPGAEQSYVLASLNDLLTKIPKSELTQLPNPANQLDLFNLNYLTAMVEVAAAQKQVLPPTWTQKIPPLPTPYFSTSLQSAPLKLYLLTHSPIPFRRRNLFIDTTIGGRV